MIAIEDDNIFFYIDRYNIDLFGNATYYMKPLPIPEVKMDEDIRCAIEMGWKDYLIKMAVLRNDRSFISEKDKGLFFTEPLMRNITGVIAKHRDDFYLLANPFAERRINYSAVLDELKGCRTGWED